MRNRGLTLVELLIAVALGSMLCLAGATLLIKSKRAYLQDEQLARLQENGHHALRLLTRELSMAGYFGGSSRGDIVPNLPGGSECYRHMVGLEGVLEHYDNLLPTGESKGNRDLPEACARPGYHQAGADALLLRRVMDLPAVDRGQRQTALSGGLLYLRSDRNGAALVRGADGLAGDSSLWRFHPQLFFLRDYSRERGDGVPALCRIRLSPDAPRTAPVECLVEGVEQLQVEFGIDSDGDRRADRYVSSPTQAEIARAIIARINVLLRSPLPLPGHRDSNQYTLGNAVVEPPDDGHFRRVLTTSVLLRNSDALR